jgi:diguanylate cyclase (GGDEF)-like protein
MGHRSPHLDRFPDPVGPGRAYLGAALAIAVALLAAMRLPVTSVAAMLLIAMAAGMTVFAAIVPWTLMAVARERRRLEDAIVDAAERFVSTRDRADLPDPDTLADPRLRRLAEAIDDLGRLTLRADRRNHYLARTIDHEVESRTRKQTLALHREAATDPLTGLGNRRRLEQAIEEIFSDAGRRRDDTVAAVLIDLDHFKQVNDTLGHAVGDECLKFVGDLLASSLRDGDVAVRLGGDEFVLLLPSLGEREAAAVARRLAELHRQRVWPHLTVGPPTLSLGVAAVHRAMADAAEMLLERADTALYAVKGSGRDAVGTWSQRPRAEAPGPPPEQSRRSA